MNYQATLFRLLLAAMLTLCLPAPEARPAGAATPLPDSLLTLEQAQRLQYNDPALAGRIIAEMRRRGMADIYHLDQTEASILYNNMEFSKALTIYRRMMDSREVRSDGEKMKQRSINLRRCRKASKKSPHHRNSAPA